eukprot:CAMPEP_0201281072 /NCGR_PEP_ID=MMETSP1317-20130820/1206_1 /ASSEMBLY_ACC=CAM_ASM_000770 /TAXON_ID=187299 /ORGANISM="Undescribed Undescribed, Strain Undescribed" /LENGTH=68 /DNA_ID=CAMNT_0047589963 /DNA_START=32 /DNA_END=238 /DNA_ORIENTATION=-
MKEVVGDSFLGREGEVSADQVCGADLVAIYFSAHWCPPCREFTPILANFYNEAKAAGHKLEVIFVSRD